MTTTPEQIEAVARAMWLSQYPSLTWELDANSTAKIEFRVLASAAINAMRPLIRAEVLEEAAKVAAINCLPRHEITSEFQAGVVSGRLDAAADIRALKEKNDSQTS